GQLAPEWNARDEEYEPGRSKLLHYTTLHTQPWRPFPQRFAYLPNPCARPWLELEASADAAAYRVFTRERPSAAWRAQGSPPPLEQTPGDDLPWRLDELFRGGGPAPRIAIAADAAGPRTPEWWISRIEAVAAAHPEREWEAVAVAPDGRRRERAG